MALLSEGRSGRQIFADLQFKLAVLSRFCKFAVSCFTDGP
jgi:hypothetical protein